MLRWPSVANKFIPMLKQESLKSEFNGGPMKKEIALQLLTEIQPLIFLEEEIESPLALVNVLENTTEGSNLWHKIAVRYF